MTSDRKHYCVLALGLELGSGLGLGLAEIRFWSNVFLSKCVEEPRVKIAATRSRVLIYFSG